jgi:putative nucleotidyltransferase with HDIG domain
MPIFRQSPASWLAGQIVTRRPQSQEHTLYTGSHSLRVAALSRSLLRELNVAGLEAATILAAARLHDIGKFGIPARIIGKPGPLSPAEKRLLDTHAERGGAWLDDYGHFARGADIVRHHHERWDGDGYPDRLQGLAIPRGARIIAVADSFDAMTNDRPYRASLAVDQAARALRAGRGQQWDPAVVDAFLGLMERGHLPLPAPRVPGRWDSVSFRFTPARLLERRDHYAAVGDNRCQG